MSQLEVVHREADADWVRSGATPGSLYALEQQTAPMGLLAMGMRQE